MRTEFSHSDHVAHRGRSVGLTLRRTSEMLLAEPFYHEFIAGLELALQPAHYALLLQILPDVESELETFERWKNEGHVDGVVLVDLVPGDVRLTKVRELGLPAVAISDVHSAGGLTSIWTEDDVVMQDAVDYLEGLGHRSLGHVGGPAHMAHSAIRSAALARRCGELGLSYQARAGDYSEEFGRTATTELLIDGEPTAIIFDNDVMALGGLRAAFDMGLKVPQDVSLLAWDDSALCELAEPPLSVMNHDVLTIGELAGTAVLEAIRSAPPSEVRAPRASIIERGSTAGPLVT
ncbi:LacI family DNA-binding transcriptional regulator [Arthrobacter sp. TMS2-4]